MTRAELISAMAKEAGITKRQAEKALNSMQSNVVDAICKGEKVTLVGFGTFSTVSRRARTGRNPQTGTEIRIPVKRVPKFAPGIQLRGDTAFKRGRKTERTSGEGGGSAGKHLGDLARIFLKYLP